MKQADKITELKRNHDRRVTELLEANNALLERARKAESAAVHYCKSGEVLEGLEQGALAVLSNLLINTNADHAEFIIGNAADGDFKIEVTRMEKENADAK